MRISRDSCKTDMGQEGDAMPLGIQQNNDFTQFTMDVWNDKIFYQEKEFPAGFMAMSILNIPEEKLPELIQAGGAPTFLFPVVVQGSDEEAAAVFPQLRERILYLTELLWKYPPFCYNDYEKEMRRIISCLTRETSCKYGHPIRSSRRSS
mgnify:FL=1